MSTDVWDVEHRSSTLRKVFLSLAALIFVIHLAWAWVLPQGDTGVTLRLSDQLSFVFMGTIMAGLFLIPLRFAVKAGKAGVEVTGVIGTSRYTWEDIQGFSFPLSSKWARMELPAHEYVPLVSVLIWDKHDAPAVMKKLRECHARYAHTADS